MISDKFVSFSYECACLATLENALQEIGGTAGVKRFKVPVQKLVRLFEKLLFYKRSLAFKLTKVEKEALPANIFYFLSLLIRL